MRSSGEGKESKEGYGGGRVRGTRKRGEGGRRVRE